MSSEKWVQNHKVIEEIESMEDNLKEEYYKKKYREERRALDKMDSDPAYFYKYASNFCRKGMNIPSWRGPNGLVSDGGGKAQILKKQYSSVWYVHFVPLADDSIGNLFKGCNECHECKEDKLTESVKNHREAILEFSRVNNSLTDNEY